MNTAFRQREAAIALLEAASQSYAAALESYNYGVRSLLDVTAAQRTLAQARSTDVLARTQVLSTLADLAFRTGMRSNPTRRPDHEQWSIRRSGAVVVARLTGGLRTGPFLRRILGSFFPAWLVCLAWRLLLTVGARWLLLAPAHSDRSSDFDLSESDGSYSHSRCGLSFFDREGSYEMSTIPMRRSKDCLGRFSVLAIVIGAVRRGLWCSISTQLLSANRRFRDLCKFHWNRARRWRARLLRLSVRDNQFVKQGDLLFEIDDRPYRYAWKKPYPSRPLLKARSQTSGEESRPW